MGRPEIIPKSVVSIYINYYLERLWAGRKVTYFTNLLNVNLDCPDANQNPNTAWVGLVASRIKPTYVFYLGKKEKVLCVEKGHSRTE